MPVAADPIINSARNAGNGAIRLDVVVDADAITYKVYRDPTAVPTTEITTLETMPYFDTTGASGTDYFYRVKATNGTGDSGFSNEVHVLQTDTQGRSKLPIQKVDVVASVPVPIA